MSPRRLCLLTLAAVGADALVLVWVPVWGVRLRLTPAFVFLVGAEEGSDRGAGCGFLAGCLTALLGASPWQIALLTSLGTLAGEVFHRSGTFWGKWLTFLVPLAGLEGLLALGHWLMGAGLLGALRVAGLEGLFAALCFPLAFLLFHFRLPRWRQKRPKLPRRKKFPFRRPRHAQ